MTASMTADPTAPTPRVFRIEVRPVAGEVDPKADAALAEARAALPGVAAIRTAHVFLIEAPLREDEVRRIGEELLADPINQTLNGAAHGDAVIEVHYQPGVMDPVAQSTREAIVEMLPHLSLDDIEVRTGTRYDLAGQGLDEAALRAFAERALANTVIQDIHLSPFRPDAFPHGHAYELQLTHVPIRGLDDEGLLKLSRDGHLFLSLDEMKAIQSFYVDAGREPTDVELETLAQTWSEHCVHKTLKSTITYTGDDLSIFRDKPGHTLNDDGSVTIHNLLKSTVAAATFKLRDSGLDDWLVSVFDDNAGVVRFDDTHGVCIKVETHNHPSAIEPYGGAATGIGGCIRDIMGTGLFANPIANTDSFCVAHPDGRWEVGDGRCEMADGRWKEEGEPSDPSAIRHPPSAILPNGVIHPRRILQQVVAGVRDYGNRMGIPTVNGMVYFDDAYLGNPLVFAGCVGLIPLDKCFGSPNPGDRIVILGGATGRDGIHGATFSSAELTDTHADEFSHAVQIGNAITQKKTMDVIARARDHERGCLFTAISDCGAGGFSSAVGEMGEKVGAFVTLETAPLKYAGLSYNEIWISEAQERMPLAVPPQNVDALRALCDAEDVVMCDLGHFGHEENGEPTLKLTYHGAEVGKISMPFLHDGIPMPTRTAAYAPAPPATTIGHQESALDELLTALLAHPNIASKHWIVRQYDHEVQGGSVVKPLVGPEQDGPSDAAVIRPKLDSPRAVALSNGVAPHLAEHATAKGLAVDGDSYAAALAAIDEAVRNAVCVGADPSRIAILDNFCWPSCDDPAQLAALVRAAEGCYDGALAYRTPFVSGKDSLHNQFTTDDGRVITIPQTLLITALGIVPDARRARTMDAKAPGHALFVVGLTDARLGGAHLTACGRAPADADLHIPRVDFAHGPKNAQVVAQLIAAGRVAAAHDCSDGGLLVAAAEMAFAGRVGLDLDLAALPSTDALSLPAACFAETPSRYLLEVAPDHVDAVVKHLRDASTPFGQVGTFADHDRLTLRTPDEGRRLDVPLAALLDAWRKPLDW